MIFVSLKKIEKRMRVMILRDGIIVIRMKKMKIGIEIRKGVVGVISV